MLDTIFENIRKDIIKVFAQGSIEPVQVDISEHSEGIIIKITQMYDYVDLSFDNLKKVSEIVCSDNININEKDFYSGCETCDYGSEYWVDLYVKLDKGKLCDMLNVKDILE